jgi:hypothetical protein
MKSPIGGIPELVLPWHKNILIAAYEIFLPFFPDRDPWIASIIECPGEIPSC